MSAIDRITTNPNIMNGKPCVYIPNKVYQHSARKFTSCCAVL